MQNIQAETGLSLSTITEKAKSIIKNLIHNYASFDISTIDKFTHKVIRAFAHDLNLPITFEVSLDTENLLTEAVDAIIAEAGNDEVLTSLLVDFTMEKTDDDKSWDISREIMDTGKLILNENNREEITHFQNKTITEFIEIKIKLTELCVQIEAETVELATEALLLIENNGVDIKSFSAGHFPNHLTNIKDKKFNPNNKTYHEFDDIKINKTASDRVIIENIIPDLLEILARSSTNASPSRTAAYWLMIAKIPVTAATPIAKYLAPSFADVNLSNPANTKIAINTREGAI
jgi:ATP-dependent exoDNAse (exonuclease V) beta subunit